REIERKYLLKTFHEKRERNKEKKRGKTCYIWVRKRVPCLPSGVEREMEACSRSGRQRSVLFCSLFVE
ncbi:MAG: hypothetical protein OEV18_11440, partial [Deltaproteobacteria bacterium]|nr:hypothetical protein [Deltaproteobacteria bacterium]